MTRASGYWDSRRLSGRKSCGDTELRGGQVRIGMVQQVKDVGADVESVTLFDRESAGEGHPEIDLARAVERVAAEIAESAGRLNGKCRRIEIERRVAGRGCMPDRAQSRSAGRDSGR